MDLCQVARHLEVYDQLSDLDVAQDQCEEARHGNHAKQPEEIETGYGIEVKIVDWQQEEGIVNLRASERAESQFVEDGLQVVQEHQARLLAPHHLDGKRVGVQ